MEWNLKKIPCWDFTELEQGAIPDIDSVSGSSSYGVGQGIKGNFCMDLKLGQVIDSSTSKMGLSGASKRAKMGLSGSCLVDECNADLSKCKEYHRRHKVCELHSKTPQVSINGQNQRFCQQCSRFHSLEEFDEGKRSCRKRLDGHNRRRRKPQPDISHAASLFSSHQGATMLQFSSPHMYQTTTLTNPIWTDMVKSEVNPTDPTRHSTLIHNQNPFPESSPGTQQFRLVHHNGPGSGSGSGSASNLKLNHQTTSPKLLSFAANSSSGRYEKLFCDGYTSPVRVQSDCALSLLSQTSCTTLNHVMHHSANSFSSTPNQLDHHGPGYGGLESIMDPNGNSFYHNHHVSRGNETPQTFPFDWE